MHKKLEIYLQQLRSQLGNVPIERREAEIREVRQHIEALIADYQQSGENDEDAVTKALQKFGSPRTNGHALRRAWQRERRRRMGWTAIVGSFITMACLLAIFFTGNTVRTSPLSPPSQSGGIADFDRQHQAEVQAIQQRWLADNLAIQRMPKGDFEAVGRAQLHASNRLQNSMNASNLRWMAQVQAWQGQQFVLWVLLPVSGATLFFLCGLLLLRRNRLFNKHNPLPSS